MKEGPSIARDEQTLIDAIESAERRKDATILRDIQLALADELPTEELPELIEEMAQELADEYHTIAMWVMHPPEPRGDGRNVHAHILLATRELAPKGDGFAGKLRILDGRKTGPGEIVKLRNAWCAKTNARLERAGSGARIYPGRRLDAPPMPTIPRRYIARAHKRAARRERIAARREGRKIVPIRMRVAELATLGKPANRAMGEIAKHVAAGYDVPVSEREYAKTARTRYERAEEYDRAQRDASHYESLPFVREELASAHGKLEEVEARIGELRAARALDSVGPEAIASAAAVALVGPSVIEDAAGESELKLAARTDLKLAGARDGVRPVALAPVPGAPLAAPPAVVDAGAEREPEFKRRGASVLDAGARDGVRPVALAPVPGAPLAAPPAVEDAGAEREPEFKRRGASVLDAGARDGVRPVAFAPVPVAPLMAPPAAEDDGAEREPEFKRRGASVLDADARDGVRPVALAPVPVAPLMAPPAVEDDGAEREPEFKRRGASVLDAGGGPARPEPIVAVAGTGLEVPRALPDDGRGPDLEESVEYLVEFYGAVDGMARELIDDYSDRIVFADLVEEAMRYQIREAPASAPRLPWIPRDAEANRQCVNAWSKALRPEMNELVRLGADHERIEQHITTVCERAQDDDAWREQVLAEFTRLIAGAYVMDFAKVQLEDADRAGLEARRVVEVRLAEQLAEGGIDAWSEQTVARAAGLDVDWRFGGLARSRASGLNAEDTLRLVLYELIRIARTLKRTFPGSSAELGRAATAGEWYGRLQHVMSEVRRFVSEPKMRQKLINLTAASMLPDLRLEQSSAGSGRELAERAPPTLAERDRALRELARQRARNAGIEDNLDNGDRTRLRRELDGRLERMLEGICLDGVDLSLAIGALAPDGVPESGETAGALARGFAQWFKPGLNQIRAVEGSGREHEERMRVLEGCRKVVSDATKRRLGVDTLVEMAGAHYEAEWLPRLEDADPRGARERGEVRAELEAQILAGVEAAGEAQILNYAGIKIEDLLPYGAGELSGLLDDGGFVDGITLGRPEREPVRSAVERWRGHCETHLGDIASMLLEALWPEHWERYRKTRRRGEPKRVPTRDERDQAVLDATPQRGTSRDQGPDSGPGW